MVMARYLNVVATGGRKGGVLSGLGHGLAQTVSPVAFGASALRRVTGADRVGSVIAGTIVGIGTAAFYYGISRESKSLLVKIPGYTIAGLTAAGVLFLVLGSIFLPEPTPGEKPEAGEV
jgi:hypothetical protein